MSLFESHAATRLLERSLLFIYPRYNDLDIERYAVHIFVFY